jgi:diguanylate cyclase (GGDEF)-like protein
MVLSGGCARLHPKGLCGGTDATHPVIMVAAQDPQPADFPLRAARALQHLQDTVGLDDWAVSRVQGEEYVLLSVLGEDNQPGDRVPWRDTLCYRVESKQAGWATPDVDAVPLMAEARDRLGAPIKAFVSVALCGDRGELLGTLCGVGRSTAGPELLACKGQVDTVADLLGALLSAELRLEREARQREVAEINSQTDVLTGLGNRRRWDEQVALEEDRCRRYGSSAAVLTVDLNGLKAVNDKWGHDAGDALLRQLAIVLRRECRPSDVLVRLGGDEFAALLAEVTREQADELAHRLRLALVAAKTPASVGTAMRGADGLGAAWRAADSQMYQQKRHAAPLAALPPTPSVATVDPSHETLIQELLTLARTHVDAEIAFIGRFDGDVRVMRAVQSSLPLPIGPGYTEGLETTYCQKIVLGELPRAIPDTSLSPVAMALPITTQLPIGSYLGVPVNLPVSGFYGTLCCLSRQANPQFNDKAVAFLESIASSLSRVLQAEETDRAGRRQVLVEVDGLLHHNAMTMAYQPVVNLRTGRIGGLEALTRFDDQSRTTSQWFDEAARVERTSELELRTAGIALYESASWPGDLWLNLSASVVVSPAAAHLFEGRDLSRIVLEVSEHEEVADYAAVLRALAPLRERGLRLAVDDAGAGFSSLRHVLELDPDIIKLDISLVRGLPTDLKRRALVSALVAFAVESGSLVVAEGIETEDELDALHAVGVELGQGFFLGRAQPADLRARGTVDVPQQRRAPVHR